MTQLVTFHKDYTWCQYRELTCILTCTTKFYIFNLSLHGKVKKTCFLTMMLSTTCIDFRSLRRLERSSPTSSTSFGSLFFSFLRVTFNSWRLLRGSLNCEDNAYGPPDSFISKSYDSWTECSSIKKVISLSNIFCDVLVYWLAPAVLAFPWGRIFIPSEVQELVRIDTPMYGIYKFEELYFDSNSHSFQSFDLLCL